MPFLYFSLLLSFALNLIIANEQQPYMPQLTSQGEDRYFKAFLAECEEKQQKLNNSQIQNNTEPTNSKPEEINDKLINIAKKNATSVEYTSPMPMLGTTEWLEWAMKQPSSDILLNREINCGLNEYINILTRDIAELENELEHASVTIEELNMINTAYTSSIGLSGLGTCIMFAYKDNLCPLHTQLIKKIGLYALFLMFTMNGIQYASEASAIIQQKENYSEELRAKLDTAKQLLAALKLLRANRRPAIMLRIVSPAY